LIFPFLVDDANHTVCNQLFDTEWPHILSSCAFKLPCQLADDTPFHYNGQQAPCAAFGFGQGELPSNVLNAAIPRVTDPS